MASTKYFLIGMLLLATLIVYPYLPHLVATHWNMRNQANGYSPNGCSSQ